GDDGRIGFWLGWIYFSALLCMLTFGLILYATQWSRFSSSLQFGLVHGNIAAGRDRMPRLLGLVAIDESRCALDLGVLFGGQEPAAFHRSRIFRSYQGLVRRLRLDRHGVGVAVVARFVALRLVTNLEARHARNDCRRRRELI